MYLRSIPYNKLEMNKDYNITLIYKEYKCKGAGHLFRHNDLWNRPTTYFTFDKNGKLYRLNDDVDLLIFRYVL